MRGYLRAAYNLDDSAQHAADARREREREQYQQHARAQAPGWTASLLLHEGRSVVYVARQLGHDARLTLTTYGHVIAELDDEPRAPAEDAIREARRISCVPGVSEVGVDK